MDIKQEDLIRFWTWVGLNFKYSRAPELELDLIYRYAIPKLQKEGYATELTAHEHKGFKVRIAHIIRPNFYQTESDSPTEALYNAIMKVIDNEVKH